MVLKAARLAQKRIDLVVLVPGGRLPRALKLAVVHLADPVLRIDEVGRHPVPTPVGRGVALRRRSDELRPEVGNDLEVDADLATALLQDLRGLRGLRQML